jgi:D-alanine--poly(phosphoribitol) ligase subunit 1
MELIEHIDQWAVRTPEHVAHISGDSRISYRDLRAHSDALANHLAAQLPHDHSPIVVLGRKEPELVVAFLASIKSGHPYVPLDSALPEGRITNIVQSSGAQLILTPSKVSEMLQQPPNAPPAERHALAPEDPFYIIYTSGSTGTPKGVVITAGCVESFMQWMLSEHPLREQGETILGIVPFSFDVAIMDLYLSLYKGGTHFSLTRDEIENPARLYRTLAGSNATVWISTPSFAQLCLAERSFGAPALPYLRLIVLAGEVLAPDLAAELLRRFPEAELWNAYGPTEATVLTTSVRIDPAMIARYPALPIGYPRPGGRVLVVAEDGRAVQGEERGEIVIAGPHVSPGYLNRPDLTAKSFFVLDGQRAYHTGDWGRIRDGLVFFEGRRDNQIKLHGYRIELGDVEENLQKLPGVRDAVVVPRLRDGLPERLVAFVILAERPPGSDFEAALELRKRLAERLPDYMLPQAFRFVDAFPMTLNGKADRTKLAEMLE